MADTYHHGDLKAALISYATEHMERSGFDRLTMRELAQAVGVSHAAAYRHFADKHALLDTIAVAGFEQLLAEESLAVAAAGADPRARMKASGLAYVNFAARYPRRLMHMFGAAADPAAPDDLIAAGANLFGSLESLVREGQHLGHFRPGEPRDLAHACWAIAHGVSSLLVLSSLCVPAALDVAMARAERSLDVFLDGLCTQSSK